MSVKCFMVRPADRARRSLRRYQGSGCPGPYGYHNAHAPLDVVPDKVVDGCWQEPSGDLHPHDDPRWPTKCEYCDFAFTDAGNFQLFVDHVYVDDAGAEYSLREAKNHPGMMWDAWWMAEHRDGGDGRYIVAVCPDGTEWSPDSRASNCTMPDDNAHRCWCRHGEPPNITVDKNGLTCGAGAGSIVGHSGYHGFLRNGEFV